MVPAASDAVDDGTSGREVALFLPVTIAIVVVVDHGAV
jgi:hypothetical protein